jgi:hypothetical protein
MKWFGKIAFADQKDDGTGVWKSVITERDYYGDVLRNSKRDENSTVINSNITLSNQLSVVADPFILDSFTEIVYVEIFGKKWKVSSVDVNYPRLTINFGELYAEES